MSETVSLHIQASESDSGPIRVVELSGSSARIGRSPSCEVQIADPALAPEQCVLRRRGSGWLLVPVGPPGAVWVDGRAVERGQLLSLDAPFRVGDHWLTLQRSNVSAHEWGSFRTPIPVGMRSSPAPASAGLRAEAAEGREPQAPPAHEESHPEGSGPESEAERLSRWQALREQRERWRGARGGEALGGALASGRREPPRPIGHADLPPGHLARAPPVHRTEFPPPSEATRRLLVDQAGRPPRSEGPPPPPDRRAASPQAPSGTELGPASRATGEAPTVGRIPGSAPVPVPASGDAEPNPTHSPRERVPEGRVRVPDPETEPAPPAGEVSVAENPAPPDVQEPENATPAVEANPVLGPDAEADTSAEHEALVGPDAEADPSAEPEPLTRPSGTLSRGERVTGGPIQFETPCVNQAPFVTDTTFAEPRDWRAPRVDEKAPARPAAVEPAPQTSPPRTSPEWPSAQTILAMHREMRGRCAPSRPQDRPIVARPVPTVGEEPDHWKVPLWLGWLPLFATATLAGVVGLPMAWTWASDDRAAGIVSNQLASRAPIAAMPLDVTEPVDAPWWKTTSGNLVQWAMYRDRTEGDARGAEAAWRLMSAARRVSPLHAAARFASARPIAPTDGPAPPVQSLGLSRDVVALAWTGQQLLKAGKKDAAARAYRSALIMASEADLDRLPEPTFNDDRQVGRYALPHEDLVGGVVREMASCTEWTFEDWSKAFPQTAIVRLVAARVLRERGDADAERAIDAAVAEADTPTEEGPALSLHLAAQAEALALRSQWKEAEERYQRAVELMPDDTIRRSWYVNLADLELRLNDEPKRRRALEAARGLSRNDEISRRVSDLIKAFGGRAEITALPASTEKP